MTFATAVASNRTDGSSLFYSLGDWLRAATDHSLLMPLIATALAIGIMALIGIPTLLCSIDYACQRRVQWLKIVATLLVSSGIILLGGSLDVTAETSLPWRLRCEGEMIILSGACGMFATDWSVLNILHERGCA